MPTKPYSLQSPEQIAKDYAGNKQKIAQAAQSGLLDPTAAVMAGMFIDRMRSAQTQEQGPPSTVAQQVFAPPPPPMQMGAMPPGAPPMGAPRPPMAAPPPQGAPPVGMAGGGLTTLPLPDNMFDEPDGMGYAGGGIVAFAGGGATDEPAILLAGKYFDPVTGVETAAPYGGQYVEGEFDTSLGSGRRFRPKEGATPRTLAADPASKRPVGMRDLRSALGVPDDFVPFGAPSTLLGRGVEGAARGVFRMGERAERKTERDVAALRAEEQQLAYTRAQLRNSLLGITGGGTPVPLPPKPAPATKPAAKPAAVKPAAAPRPAAPARPAPAPASASLLAAGVAPRAGVTPIAAPRAGGPAPTAPRVGGLAPAGPALSASPAAAPGGGPFTLGGMSEDPAANIAALKALAPQDTTMRDAMAKRYADMSSPEALAAQKKQDFWGSLAQIGFGMAGSNSPYFLQAAGQAASSALPGMQQAAKERKAQELAGLQGQLGIETTRNQEASALAKYGQELAAQVASGKMTKENADRNYALAVRQLDAEIAQRGESNAIQRAGLAQRGSGGGGRAMTTAQMAALRARTLQEVREGSARDSRYNKLMKQNPALAEQYLQNAADARISYLLGGGGGDGFSVQE
jgi:hypothetical protein